MSPRALRPGSKSPGRLRLSYRLKTTAGSMRITLNMALTDPLTGFYNQRYLMRHLHGLLGAGQTTGIAVMMIDVDHFKSINDRWGHPVGDRALRCIA